MKRITLDLPEDMHQEFLMYCASKKTKMAKVLREFLDDLLAKERKRLKIK